MAISEIKYDDVKKSLLKGINFSEEEVVFYASRRHWVEVLPEMLTGGWGLLTLLAFWLNFPSLWQVYLPLSALLIVYMLLERWRWEQDRYILTSLQYLHVWWSIWPEWSLQRYGRRILVNTRVYQPGLWRALGFDVGKVWSQDIAEGRATEPLMPHPHILQQRMVEAATFRPQSREELLWRH